MQPRRETEQTPWENQPPASGHGFGAAEDDAYETVKPVGYEARDKHLFGPCSRRCRICLGVCTG